MDDIDRAKIGKRDEPLSGWDHIRKPKMNTNYPPMKARGAQEIQESKIRTSSIGKGASLMDRFLKFLRLV